MREVVEFMRKEGRAEWVVEGGGRKGGYKEGGGLDGGSVFWVWWRDVEEWAGRIAEWVSGSGEGGGVGCAD